MTIYYHVQWFNKEKNKWMNSTVPAQPTLMQAREQLQDDIRYFYDDIQIRLVRVEETTIEEHKGSNKRSKK